MTTYKGLERQNLLKIAQEYERKGYQVVTEPGPQTVPNFLTGYRPDLIAWNAKESVVVEIKSYASLVSADDLLSHLAQVVQQQPGWRFELVVVNPKRSSQFGNSSKSTVQDRLADALQLRDEGYSAAALLAALSALEAALLLADASADAGKREPSALNSAKLLFKQNVLTSEEVAAVTRALNLRNSVTHNSTTQVSDNKMIDDLLAAIRTILQRINASDRQPTLAAA